MAARKLAQEIDKTIKKIQEGIALFQGTYEKLQACTNQAQKEKLEDNLKTQIKKLQRNRDQLKSWAAGNDVKDKKPLLDWRKAIETEMEKFKAVEKEMKTKAFSKEGLSAAAKMDPKEQEKDELSSFLADMVSELERQVESLEAEEESLQATTRKGKKDHAKAERLQEIVATIEKHKWHIKNLELLNRAVANGNVEVEDVNDVKESIRYYVEENSNMMNIEESDTIYEQFDLEAEDSTWQGGNDIEHVSSHDAASVQDENAEPSEKLGKTKSAGEGSGTTARRPSTTFKTPLPVLSTIPAPLSNVTNTSAATPMKPAPPPARPPGETLRYASAAAQGAAADKTAIAPLPPPPGSQPATLAPQTSVQTESAKPSPATSASVPAKSTKAPSLATASPVMSQAATGSIPPTPALETSEPVLSKGKATAPLETAPEEPEDVSSEPSEPETPPPHAATNGAPKAEEDVESIFHLPECLQDLVAGYSLTKDLGSDPTAPEVQRLMNLSFEHGVDASDLEKPRFYKPRMPYKVPRTYPSKPSSTFDDSSVFERVDNDTLFFLFYYKQNTYSQHQAARTLKGQSWRFHKQYQTWFQRHEEPKTITEEYEQGTYRFFDYESTWMNRRKADFQFAYRFLEDDL